METVANRKRWLFIAISVLCGASMLVLLKLNIPAGRILLENIRGLNQIFYYAIGIASCVIIQNLRPEIIRGRTFLLVSFIISLGLLTLVLLFGSEVKGAKSWFDLGLFSFQPSDIVKIIFILILAKFFSKRHAGIQSIGLILSSLFYVILPVGLILLQPDFGTAIIYLAIWFVIVVSSGLSIKHFLLLFGSVITVSLLAWTFMFATYQKDRIRSFIDPSRDPYGSGYNVNQSIIAVGAGGLFGKGYGEGTQSRMAYLPESHTDFIFASFVEEWGFIGAIIIISALMVIVWQAIKFSKVATNNMDSLYAIGFATYIVVHATIHIGMNIGILPVTGLPMPFMSSGGSHILAEFVGLGVLLSLMKNRRAGRAQESVEFLGPAQYTTYEH